MSVAIKVRLEKIGKGWKAIPEMNGLRDVDVVMATGYAVEPTTALRDCAERLTKKLKEQVLLILNQGGNKQ